MTPTPPEHTATFSFVKSKVRSSPSDCDFRQDGGLVAADNPSRQRRNQAAAIRQPFRLHS